MRYANSIEITLPRQKVVQLLADPALIPMWLRGVVLHEPLRGAHGQVGSVSRVVMQSGRRTMEGTETITRREPADLHGIPADVVVHFAREIVAEGMWNSVHDRLTEATPETTLWESDSEMRFDSLPMRLMARIIPGVFRRQSQRHMEDFKAFAEQGEDVRDE